MRRIALILAIIFLSFYPSESTHLRRTENNYLLPLIGIRINGGAKYTNNRNLEVEIKSLKTDKSLLESMKVGFDPDLLSASWQPYAEEAMKIQFTGGDGEKTIYAQLRDKAGNVSPIESNKIIFDTTPPANGKIMINKGEKYTNDKLGRVLVNVTAEEAHELMISNTDQFPNGRWESYKESVKWVIDAGSGDGEKQVFVKFRDLAGNESQIVTASIILDVTPPSDGSLVINNGDKFTRSRKLKLLITSTDATKVRIVSRGEGKNYDFTPESNGRLEVVWETDSMQGNKSIKAYFMDEAKNTTKIPAEATIMLKTNPPQKALINIDQGRKYTNHKDGLVNITLSAKENPNQLKMLISNKPNFEGAGERAFTNSITNWKLESDTDGLKTIYVRLIDEAGNISEVSSSEIFLDRTPPTINSFGINNSSEWCISMKVMLTSEIDDAIEAKYTNNPNTLRNIPWEKYNPQRADWTLLPGDGEKTVYAIFRDNAGNVSELVSAKTQLDMTPPKGEIIINGGMRVTNHPEGVVKLQINHDEDVIGMQLTNLPKFDDVQLLPLEKTIENWKIDNNEEGLKTVFCRLQDKAGNYSKVLTASVILDRTPPQGCELIINNNDPYIRNDNKRVSLSLRAEGADAMLISNKESMDGAEWIPFKTAIGWTLEGPEGIHYVHVKFKDAAGNESAIISKSIKSDFSPPKIIKFNIDDGAEYCSDPQGMVNLTFEVEDALTMAISNSQLNDTSTIKNLWEPYKSSKSWKLDGEDGLKIVYGRFRDDAGNITHEYYDKIVLDRIPPSDARISINNGAQWLTDKEGMADIMLYANGASDVMISNSTDFSKSKWEPIVEIKKGWQLIVGKTEAVVYAKFKDKAGNVSDAVSSSIKVDLDPPRNAKISIDNNAKYVQNKDRKITISLGAEEATGMRLSNNKDFRNARWEPYATSKEVTFTEPDGEKTFFVQYSDDAGNLSDVISATIILDTTPPKINDFTIDDGEEWTNNTDKKVHLKINASDAMEMMIADNPDFTNASWESYQGEIAGYTLPGDDGEKILFLKLRDEAGNISRIVTAKINLKRAF
jgi:hypothetical protein